MDVWTLGHSTHTLERFVALLASQGVEQVVDVRTVPRSARHPHFASENLTRTLPERGIGYVHLASLGGWRRSVADSPNGAWRNRSFRGYADYAMSAEFGAGLERLGEIAVRQRTAVMCAEALWWRCHRRLIADHLVVQGHRVMHIGADGLVSAHRLASFAVVEPDGRITYPAVADS